MLKRRYLCFLSLIFMLLTALSAYGPRDFLGLYGSINSVEAAFYDGENVQATGRIFHKEIRNEKPVYYVENATIWTDGKTLKNISFILYLDSDNIPNTSTIKLNGRLQFFDRARNCGNFDAKNYYNSLGFACKITASQVDKYAVSKVYSKDFLYRLSRALSQVYAKELPGEEGGFLSSVTLGDKSALTGDLKTLFQNVGVAHVLAVSGLHISFLCMGIYSLLRNKKCSFLTSSIMSGIFAVMYGIMTGSSVSSKRAIGMFLIYLLAQMLGESYDMLTALSLMACLLLLKNPLYIKNTSFIFSFGAVLAVIFVAKPLAEDYKLYCKSQAQKRVEIIGIDALYNVSTQRKIFEKLAGGLTFSFGITVATYPLVTSMFYQVPTYSILLNTVILPLMAPLLGLGLVGGFLGLISPFLGHLILGLCHYIIFFFELVAGSFDRLPHAHIITGSPGAIKIIIFLTLVLFTLYGTKNFPVFHRKEGFFLRLLMLCLASLIILVPSKKSFEIDALDVGQGDGTFISAGDGSYYFIDGGSTSENEVGKYRIIPFLKYMGIQKINYWFLTHSDQDHVSGLMEALEAGYEISYLVIPEASRHDQAFDQIEKLALSNNYKIIYMKAGDEICSKNLKISCIYPYADTKSDDVNAKSLTLLINYKNEFSGFLGGDLGQEQEVALTKAGVLSKVDYLKVSHHGSKNSSASEFLQAIEPEIATISCSKRNDYGHPSPDAVARIEAVGTKIFYTMEDGQIKIKFDEKNKNLTISRYSDKNRE